MESCDDTVLFEYLNWFDNPITIRLATPSGAQTRKQANDLYFEYRTKYRKIYETKDYIEKNALYLQMRIMKLVLESKALDKWLLKNYPIYIATVPSLANKPIEYTPEYLKFCAHRVEIMKSVKWRIDAYEKALVAFADLAGEPIFFDAEVLEQYGIQHEPSDLLADGRFGRNTVTSSLYALQEYIAKMKKVLSDKHA